MAQDPTASLSPERWARLRAALEAALAEPSPRVALGRALDDDPELAAVGAGLLALDEGGSGSATPLERSGGLVGRDGARGGGLHIGPWVTQRELGAGGMGTVHLAVRADGAFHRQVAVKLIRPHLVTPEVLARFRRERQVQANLEHPGIVRMLDGGTTEDGAPYYVMEFVEGIRIDDYCDEHRLTIAERVALFRQVVDAVEYAHRRLVVHRDLKPSNILVTAQGAPKLLDFGIAKVLDAEKLSAGGDVTREVMSFLTPAYASPEQLRGRSATTASDIYSLGVLLYVLLTGRPPHETAGLSPAEVERLVEDEHPARPSVAVGLVREVALAERRDTTRLTPALVAERRRSAPREVSRALRGDLDRIVLHCMHKEPQRRYASAAALAEDLERHLTGRPILARPDSVAYRAQKFLRRNRGPVAATAVVVALLAGGLGYALEQNRRIALAHGEALAQKELAGERLQTLRTLRKQMVYELDRVLVGVPGALEASERLLQVVVDHLDVEAEAAGDDVALLKEIGGAYSSLGRVYFAGRGGHLGRSDLALRCFERARAAFARVRVLAPEDLTGALGYFKVHDDLAALAIEGGDLEGARRTLVAGFESFGAGGDGLLARSPRLQLQAVLGHDALARCLQGMGRYHEAVDTIETAISWMRTALEKDPSLRVFVEGQIATENVRRADLATLLGDFEVARERLDAAEPWLRAVLATHGDMATGNTHWVIYCRKRAHLLQGLGDPEATHWFRDMLQTARGVALRGSDDVRAKLDLLGSLIEMADQLVQVGEAAEARELGAEALALGREVLAARRDSVAARAGLARAEIVCGEHVAASGALVEASELIGAGVERVSELVAEDPAAYYAEELLVRGLIARGRLLRVEAGVAAAAGDDVSRRRSLGRALAEFERAAELVAEHVAAGLGARQRDRYGALARELRTSTADELDGLGSGG